MLRRDEPRDNASMSARGEQGAWFNMVIKVVGIGETADKKVRTLSSRIKNIMAAKSVGKP